MNNVVDVAPVSDVAIPDPVVLLSGSIPVEVQRLISRKTGNPYEALILKIPYRDVRLTIDRSAVNDVKVYLLTEDL